MTRQLYQGKILEHYNEPRNRGTVTAPDISAEVSNPNCGDDLRFTADIEDGRFRELKFEGEGCALSIAIASLLSEKISGEDVGSVEEMEVDGLFELLGVDKNQVTPTRQKCVLIAKEGVEKLVKNYDET